MINDDQKNSKQSSVQDEFNDFLKYDETPVSHSLTETTKNRMRNLLYPSAQRIFAKIFSIHILVGFFSLAFCHQFGMNPFKTTTSLADVFMRWGGHSTCMVLCGLFFTSLSFIFSSLALSAEELHVLRQTKLIQVSVLLTLSLGLFFVGGATLSFALVSFWFVGALVGGIFSIEGQYWLRLRNA